MAQNVLVQFQLLLHLSAEDGNVLLLHTLDAVAGNLCHIEGMAQHVRGNQAVKHHNARLTGRAALPEEPVDTHARCVQLLLQGSFRQKRIERVRIRMAEVPLRKALPQNSGCMREDFIPFLRAILTVKPPEVGDVDAGGTPVLEGAILHVALRPLQRALEKGAGARKARQPVCNIALVLHRIPCDLHAVAGDSLQLLKRHDGVRLPKVQLLCLKSKVQGNASRLPGADPAKLQSLIRCHAGKGPAREVQEFLLAPAAIAQNKTSVGKEDSFSLLKDQTDPHLQGVIIPMQFLAVYHVTSTPLPPAP